MEYGETDRVEVVGIGTGRIIKVRHDSSNRAIYDVELEDSALTSDGMYIARAEELRLTWKQSHV